MGQGDSGEAVITPDWHLVKEIGPAPGQIAFGPLIRRPECLACFSSRRQASGMDVGQLSTFPITTTGAEQLRRTLLWDHQTAPHWRPQLFIANATCRADCLEMASGRHGHLAAVADRTGLIRDVSMFRAIPGYWTAVARGAFTLGSAGVPVVCDGTATSVSEEDARDRAVFEALERYCAGFWNVSDLRASPAPDDGCGEAGRPVVTLRRLSGDGVLSVPADRVFMPFAHDAQFFDGSSVGLACGRDEEDARGRAVDEVVERRVVEPWLERAITVTGNRPVDHGGDEAAVISRVKLDGSVRHVAVAMACSERAPLCAVGFGCHEDVHVAIGKARSEAMHVKAHMTLSVGAELRPQSRSENWLEVALWRSSFDADAAAAVQHSVRAAAAKACVPTSEISSDRIAWRNVSTADVRSMGLEVVRAVYVGDFGDFRLEAD